MTARRIASAGLWSTIDIVARQGVLFAVSIILARLLMPADFGIIALLTFFSSLSIVFVQGGLSTALIQRQETSREEESSVFWWNLLASLLFAALLVAIGPAVSRFYGYPVLAPLMLLAAAQVVLSALGAVQTALLTRSLRFADLTKAGLASTIVAGAAGVGAALLGWGVWALAIQVATMAAVNSLVLWWVSDWRPSFHFRLRTIRHLLAFGSWFSLSSALEVLYNQGFALILGKLYGARELGIYNRAASTQLLPTGILAAIIGRLALPLFSERAKDPGALRRGLKTALGFAMLVNLPMMTGVALLPDLIIHVLFGEKWLGAAPILAILAWSGLIVPMHVLNLQVILAEGRSSTYFRVEVAKKLLGIAALVIGSFYGIFGLAYSYLAVAILALFINVEPVRRSLGYGVLAQLADLKGVIAATALMAAAVLLLRSMVDLGSAPSLLLLTAVGAGTYCAAGFALRVRAFAEGWDVARLYFGRGAEKAALPD
jgi:O-antigen/teichoic acid export membrane protein